MKQKIKEILKEKTHPIILEFLRGIYGSKGLVGALLFRHSRFLSRFYFFCFERTFSRENRAVLVGRSKYYESTNGFFSSSPLLRRNIHRIEKGLIMEPRKPVFALDYIYETVQAYKSVVNKQNFDKDEMLWAKDVLITYFKTVEDTAVIRHAKDYFYKEDEVELSCDEISRIPYQSQDRPSIPVSEDSLYQLFLRRRSVRWFQDKTIDIKKLETAVKMASLAPSACNRQPYKFYISAEKDRAASIAKFADGTVGWADNIQSIAVIVGDLSCYPHARDRHVIYIDSALAGMQFMLSLESMGLSSCPINWPDIEKNELALAQELSLEPYERPIIMIAIGYAKESGGIPFSQKKSSNNLIKWM